MRKREPGSITVRRKFRLPTAEEQAILDRWRKEAEKRAQARLRAYLGR
jgi:hypothetical protein